MTPEELWKLDPYEFNAWRRNNDLKNLFKHFQDQLPRFDDWLIEFGFTIEFLLATDKPGSFFYWESEALLIETNIEDRIDYLFIAVESEGQKKTLSEFPATDTEKLYWFKPYFLWAKEQLKTDKIIKSRYAELDTFRFILESAPESPSHSRTSISPGYQVLKLGGTKINGWGQVLHRNLDFADLDFLEIEGNFRWSQEQQIFYSSCRHVKFDKADVNFTKFFGCHFEKLQSQDTKLYGVEFYRCDMFGANFEGSSLVNVIIDKCSVSKLSFNKVEVDNLEFIPPGKEWHEGLAASYERAADNYKRFRVLYQNNGHRREAGEAYYHERFYELKSSIETLELLNAIKMVYKYGTKYAGTNFWSTIINAFGIVGNGFSFLIWGFGERPGRTIIFSVLILFFYTLIYYFSGVDHLHQDLTNSIYLSTIMFSTLGFGDYEPVKEGIFKLMLASEALIGAFTWGLFIAGYSNKAKY